MGPGDEESYHQKDKGGKKPHVYLQTAGGQLRHQGKKERSERKKKRKGPVEEAQTSKALSTTLKEQTSQTNISMRKEKGGRVSVV